jgi:hypothetical protein
MSLPIAVEINVIPIIEGQRIEPYQSINQLNNQPEDNVFPLCCCLFCIVILSCILVPILNLVK